MSMRTASLTLLCALGCTGAHDTRQPGPPSVPHTTEVARTEHFVFHNNELFNLHQFLYQCAKTIARREGEDVDGRPVVVAEISAVDGLEGSEREAFFSAIDFYRRDAIGRDLLFNGLMYEIKGQLARVQDPDGAWPAALDPGYRQALKTALPVYRTHFWPAHEQVNRAWIAAAIARLELYEAALVGRMTAAYGGRWPRGPVRVDVCVYANWAGAYTTGGPAHITLSSTDVNAQGNYALETLMHEASHTRSMFDPLRGAVDAAFSLRGTAQPGDLWHMFIFMTAGDTVRRTLAADGIEGYVEYGVRTGLYERGSSVTQHPILQAHWIPYLNGETDRATALARIAEAFGS